MTVRRIRKEIWNSGLTGFPEPINDTENSIHLLVIPTCGLGITIRWEWYPWNNISVELFILPPLVHINLCCIWEWGVLMVCACMKTRETIWCRPVSSTPSHPSAEQYSQHTSDCYLLFSRVFIYSANVHVFEKPSSYRGWVLCVCVDCKNVQVFFFLKRCGGLFVFGCTWHPCDSGCLHKFMYLLNSDLW